MKLHIHAVRASTITAIAIGQLKSSMACHESCATCDEEGSIPNNFVRCLTCADGSPVHRIFKDKPYGFCGEMCPLCAGNATPTLPDATWWYSQKPCGSSPDHSWPLHVPDSNPDDDFKVHGCSWRQTQLYLVCGCPALPDPPEDVSCTLCADGSPPTNPDALAPYGGISNVTCAKIVEVFPYGSLSGDSWSCSSNRHRYAGVCGCVAPKVHKEGCTLCHDGSEPKNPEGSFKSHNPYFYHHDSLSCQDMAEKLPFIYPNDWWSCERTRRSAASDCGCPAMPTSLPTPMPSSAHIEKHPNKMLYMLMLVFAAVNHVFVLH